MTMTVTVRMRWRMMIRSLTLPEFVLGEYWIPKAVELGQHGEITVFFSTTTARVIFDRVTLAEERQWRRQNAK
jgi:hypothetical protein